MALAIARSALDLGCGGRPERSGNRLGFLFQALTPAVARVTFSAASLMEFSTVASCSGESPFSAFSAALALRSISACLRTSRPSGLLFTQVFLSFFLRLLLFEKCLHGLAIQPFSPRFVFDLRVLASESLKVLIVFSVFSTSSRLDRHLLHHGQAEGRFRFGQKSQISRLAHSNFESASLDWLS